MCYEDFMGSYSASYTLKCVDEIAYRCGLLDYMDNLEITHPEEWDDELSNLLEELEEMIDDKLKRCRKKETRQELEKIRKEYL